jgi:hypothetical protein
MPESLADTGLAVQEVSTRAMSTMDHYGRPISVTPLSLSEGVHMAALLLSAVPVDTAKIQPWASTKLLSCLSISLTAAMPTRMQLMPLAGVMLGRVMDALARAADSLQLRTEMLTLPVTPPVHRVLLCVLDCTIAELRACERPSWSIQPSQIFKENYSEMAALLLSKELSGTFHDFGGIPRARKVAAKAVGQPCRQSENRYASADGRVIAIAAGAGQNTSITIQKQVCNINAEIRWYNSNMALLARLQHPSHEPGQYGVSAAQAAQWQRAAAQMPEQQQVPQADAHVQQQQQPNRAQQQEQSDAHARVQQRNLAQLQQWQLQQQANPEAQPAPRAAVAPNQVLLERTQPSQARPIPAAQRHAMQAGNGQAAIEAFKRRARAPHEDFEQGRVKRQLTSQDDVWVVGEENAVP